MITVLGSINVDLVARAIRLPQPGETVAGYGSSVEAGGKGANQALAARRAGANVRLIGAVGDDAFAGNSLYLLAESGIDLSRVRKTDQTTGKAIVSIGDDGENSIIVIPGSNNSLTVADADEALAGMRDTDSLLLQLEIKADVVERALKKARELRVRTILNTAPLTESAAKLSQLADIVVANETEFNLLTGERASTIAEYEQLLRNMHHRSGQILVVTLGKDGAVGIAENQVTRVEGLEILAVDTVGAGDTFCGYLAASLDAFIPFPTAMRRAVVAGSLACSKIGAQAAIPYLNNVIEKA